MQTNEVDLSVEASKERFYSLVEKVYLFKLQNGELDHQTYGDVFSAVDDIMKPINEEHTEEQMAEGHAKWTPEMREQHKQVVNDFKSNKIQWRDINLAKVKDIGKELVNMVMHSA